MFFRHLFSKAGRPAYFCKVVARGKKNLPIWRPPRVDDFVHRPRVLDDPWFRDMWGPSAFRMIDDVMRENVQRMDQMLRMTPWRVRHTGEGRFGANTDIIKASVGKDGLHMEMDVSEFGHDDISVKLAGDRLVISGKHSTKQDDHGFVSREFTREFVVPENIDSESLSCRLTDEGHLLISATVKEGEPESSRDIPIQRETSEKSESQQEDSDKTKEKE